MTIPYTARDVSGGPALMKGLTNAWAADPSRKTELRIYNHDGRFVERFIERLLLTPNNFVGTISGTVSQQGTPAARNVRCYRRSDGQIAGQTALSTGGAYTFTGLDPVEKYYVVALDDDAGATFNALICDQVTPTAGVPVAAFQSTPFKGNSPLSVTFTDTTSNVPTSWLWERNDGSGWASFLTTSTVQHPVESFPTGVWSVRLTATNTGGSSSVTHPNCIRAAPIPVANFIASPASGAALLTVVFTDTSTNAIEWLWERNSGSGWSTFSTSQNPALVFNGGTFSIRLTTTNQTGSDVEEKTNFITVTGFVNYAKWVDKSDAGVTFSNNDLTAATVSGIHQWRANNFFKVAYGRKLYWEQRVDANTSTNLCVGLKDKTDVITTGLEFNQQDFIMAYNGGIQAGGGWTMPGSGTSYGAGDTLMFAIDEAAGKVWLGKNGTWLNSDPSTGGTSSWASMPPAITYAVGAGPNTGAGVNGTTFRSDPANMLYAAPTGFTRGLWEIEPAIAAFSGTPLTGTFPLTVTFTDLSTDAPTSWAWAKNNGSGWVPFAGTPTAQHPVEVFAAGTWSVRLTVTNSGGPDEEVKTAYLTDKPLQIGLISYWKMDEASGNALDAHGTNHLTDWNTVGSAAGKIGTARDFETDNDECFYIPAGAAFTTGDIDFTISLWATIESAANRTAFSKWTGSGGEYSLYYDGTRWTFLVYGGSNVSVVANNFGAAPLGTWMHVLAWHDSVNNQLGISINNGPPNLLSHSAGLTAQSTAWNLVVGGWNVNDGQWDGLIDEVGFWKRMLTQRERSDLYNKGNGLAYPLISPPVTLLTDLISYWKLDEASGNAIDSHGTNHLTDVNTVGSAAGKIGNARDFEVGNTEYFEIASNPSLQTGDIAFTVSAWVQFESMPTPFIATRDNATSEREWQVSYGSTFDFTVFDPSATYHTVNSTGISATVGPWYFVVGWHDPVADKIYIQVNNGTVFEASHSGGAKASAAPFRIGARSYSTPFSFDGLIDEVGFWKRLLTPAERTTLYNSGNGKAYPFT